jgi:hypothetical protein
MTKIEKIQDLLEGVETDVRKATVQDILIDLADFLKDSNATNAPGLAEAIAIIKANYSH